MSPVPISSGVYWIGMNDRTTDLFEGLWPITQEGISYNTYLIDDEKRAVVDLAKSLKSDEFFAQIEQVVDIESLDYVIMNHMEPDHSGIVRMLRRLAPDVTILGTQKAMEMLNDFYGIQEGVRAVGDGDTLDLGTHRLRFVSTPFVHWPETMMTYDEADKVLFSCDAFGGYGALRGALFDEECTDLAFYEEEALRYFVNIVAVFSRSVLRAIDKLSDVSVEAIAPSHGLIWREHPERIIELYQKWSNYASEPAEVGVTLLYGSMYGNTEKMMNAVAQGVSDEGVPLSIFDVAHTHMSYILPSLWKRQGVIVGAPTYEGSLFPPMAEALRMAAHKRIRGKKVARFGSYGWSGGAQREFEQIIEPLKWNLMESFEFKGGATEDDLARGKAFGAAFAREVREG